MNSWKILMLLVVLMFSFHGGAQGTYRKKKQKVSHAQGTLWVYWGYNRSAYTKSNIRFTGPGYDITMKGAKAHDNPSPLGPTYFDLNKITVPQFNGRIGYYFKNHWAISFGYDHMKYIFADQNEVRMSGTVDPGMDEVNHWEGVYNAHPVLTNRKTFHYENSDGLNCLRFELTRTDRLAAFGNKNQFVISSNLGAGLGAIVSANDFNFTGTHTLRTVSMSGYGISAHVGARFEFFRHVFIETNGGAGIHHQVKVQTRPNDPSSFARHAYGYAEFHTVVGFLFYIRPANACDSCPIW